MTDKPTSPVMKKFYPEREAGGFTHEDNTVVFYTRVQGLLSKDMEVLDFGAGSNFWADNPVPILEKLMRLKGRCKKVTGVDPDPRVSENPWLDEAIHIVPGEPLPFEDNSIDMIVSFAVFEHISDEEFVAKELNRVLRPGGWLCAWTPNKWGYAGIGARLIPNKHHATILSTVLKSDVDMREDEDVYPVCYRMNTFSKIKQLFPESQFDHYSYYFKGPPNYHGERLWLAYAYRVYEHLTPRFLDRYLHIVLQKKPV